VPVTVLEVGPCVVTQVKTMATDGYDALQVGFLEKRKDRINKPLQGHFEKSGGQAYSRVAARRTHFLERFQWAILQHTPRGRT